MSTDGNCLGMVEGKVVPRKDAPPITDPVIAGYDAEILFVSRSTTGMVFISRSCTYLRSCSVIGSAVGIPSRVLLEFISRLISDKTL